MNLYDLHTDKTKLYNYNVPYKISWQGKDHYYLAGVLHRDDGPAFVNKKAGIESYYQNGVHHREDGPAEIGPDGFKSYWLNGVRLLDRFEYEESLDKLLK